MDFDKLLQDNQPDVDTKQPLDKAAYREKKQHELFELYDMQETAIAVVFSNDADFKLYLDMQAKMPHYSAGNILLILTQKPNATDVRTFDDWKKAERSVGRGEKGISVLAPKKYVKDETERTGISPGTVFDVSQTHGKALEPKPENKSAQDILTALVKSSPVRIEGNHTVPADKGIIYSQENKKIFARAGIDAQNAFKLVSAAVAHAMFDARNPEYDPANAQLEVLASSYLLCKRYGIGTDGYNFENATDLICFADEPEAADFRESLDIARRTANMIAKKIETHLNPQRNKDVSR